MRTGCRVEWGILTSPSSPPVGGLEKLVDLHKRSARIAIRKNEEERAFDGCIVDEGCYAHVLFIRDLSATASES